MCVCVCVCVLSSGFYLNVHGRASFSFVLKCRFLCLGYDGGRNEADVLQFSFLTSSSFTILYLILNQIL